MRRQAVLRRWRPALPLPQIRAGAVCHPEADTVPPRRKLVPLESGDPIEQPSGAGAGRSGVFQAEDRFPRDLPFRNAEAIDVAEFLHGSIVCRNVQTTSELWKRLSEKVEQNWQTYQRNLYDRSPGVLIGIADEIAATATCYSEFLCSGSDLSRRDLSYLLQFENPLDVLRDRWVLDQSTEQGTRFLGMLESLRSEGHAEQDYPLDEAYAQTQKNEMTMQL